jgi:hypothetical protein
VLPDAGCYRLFCASEAGGNGWGVTVNKKTLLDARVFGAVTGNTPHFNWRIEKRDEKEKRSEVFPIPIYYKFKCYCVTKGYKYLILKGNLR